MNELWNRLEERQDEFEGFKEWERARRQVWENVLRAELMELLTLDWLRPYVELNDPVVFLAYDWKDEVNEYWRHQWLRNLTPLLPTRALKRRKRVFSSPDDKVGKLVSELPPEAIAYKGGRDYTQNDMNRLKRAVLEVLRPLGVTHLRQRGYEADDFMATVVKVNESLPDEQQRDVVLCCNDSDILGLVSDRVTWFDLPRQHRPLVRANREDINKWRTEVKHQTPLERPSDIWVEKAIYGDTADNLPPTGDLKLTLPAIDLLNPPEEHRLWESYEHKNTISQALLGSQRCYNNITGRMLMSKVNVINVFK
jgi:hypothetical protein